MSRLISSWISYPWIFCIGLCNYKLLSSKTSFSVYNLKEWICQFFLISLPKYLGKSTGHYKPATVVATKIHENEDFEIMGVTGLNTYKWDPNFWAKGFYYYCFKSSTKIKSRWYLHNEYVLIWDHFFLVNFVSFK